MVTCKRLRKCLKKGQILQPDASAMLLWLLQHYFHLFHRDKKCIALTKQLSYVK